MDTFYQFPPSLLPDDFEKAIDRVISGKSYIPDLIDALRFSIPCIEKVVVQRVTGKCATLIQVYYRLDKDSVLYGFEFEMLDSLLW